MYHGRLAGRLPLRERRQLLDVEAARFVDPIRPSPVIEAAATDLVEAARRQRLEGLVAKRTDSLYEPGKRSGAWVKVKVSQGREFVVGGDLPGGMFDALLIGYYEGDRLLFIAKLRNGFTPADKHDIHRRLVLLETAVCPFEDLPERRNARRGLALTADAMKRCRWVRPAVVVAVAFTEWTEGNHLRHASYAGLRDDKRARDVVRERPAAA